MPPTETGERRRASRKKSGTQIIRLQIKDGMANPKWVTAELLDNSEGGVGIGISIFMPLAIGSKVVVRGKLRESREEMVCAATVKWCNEKTNGTFQAGLELGDRSIPP
jgi:hypothetical protein